MRRIMWIGVALVIMVAILGYGWLTMKNIDEVNKRRREKNAGKTEAVIIIATEPTTTVWDRIHAEKESQNANGQNTASAMPEAAQETGTADIPETEHQEEMPLPSDQQD